MAARMGLKTYRGGQDQERSTETQRGHWAGAQMEKKSQWTGIIAVKQQKEE